MNYKVNFRKKIHWAIANQAGILNPIGLHKTPPGVYILQNTMAVGGGIKMKI